MSKEERRENFIRRRRSGKAVEGAQRDGEGLLPKQRAFVEYMLSKFDMDPKEAAVKAGYPASRGSSLLREPAVAKAIKNRQGKLNELAEEFIAPIRADQESIISEMLLTAFFNPKGLFEDNNDGTWKLKSKNKIPDKLIRNVKKLVFATDNNGNAFLSSIELYDKQKALDSLSKHLGLFEKDNMQRQPTFNLDDVLSALQLPEEDKDIIKRKLLENIEQEGMSIH